MMKQLFISTLSLLLLAGCSGDEVVQPSAEDSAGVPLNIASVCVSEQVVTRTVTPVDKTSGSIRLFLEGAAPNTYTEKNNIEYTCTDGTTWQAKLPAEALYLGGKDAQVCAYNQTTALQAIANKRAVSLTTQVYDAAQDLEYAPHQTVNGTKEKKSASFVLRHAYSLIELILKKDDTYPNSCLVTQIKLQNTTLASQSTIDITDGTYGNSPMRAPFTTATNLTATADGSVKKQLLMVPCVLDGAGLALELTVDGKVMKANVSQAKLGALVAGTCHQITVKPIGTAAEILSVKETPWESKAVEGEYTPEPDPLP